MGGQTDDTENQMGLAHQDQSYLIGSEMLMLNKIGYYNYILDWMHHSLIIQGLCIIRGNVTSTKMKINSTAKACTGAIYSHTHNWQMQQYH